MCTLLVIDAPELVRLRQGWRLVEPETPPEPVADLPVDEEELGLVPEDVVHGEAVARLEGRIEVGRPLGSLHHDFADVAVKVVGLVEPADEGQHGDDDRVDVVVGCLSACGECAIGSGLDAAG